MTRWTSLLSQKSPRKYGNKKPTFNGITFDSNAERDYYLYLMSLKQSGEIQDFTRQPNFLLQESFKKNEQTFKSIHYKADFQVVHLDGHIEIVDVKPSKDFQTDVYKLKKKLFEKRYPDLTIHEVYKDEIRKMR